MRKAFLLVALALPRSRWYRLATLCCALFALCLYTFLAFTIATAFLVPSALIVLLSVLPPQPS